ncbi:DMT family transporter [Pedococcus bigeumensis]|uniref:DMT family transporter n=1 Tax=Pedococcus bigeumensis TaxID=433644 RepID=UPI002FE88492
MNPTRRTGILLALATAAISGVSVFLNGYGVKAFGSSTVYTTGKNLVAAVILLALVGVGGRRGARLTRPTRRGQWLALGAIGVIGGSVPFVLFFEGLARASSPQAAFVHKTLVLWVALLAVPLLRERLQWGHWLAIALLVVGQVGLAGGAPESFGTPGLMILGATLLWSLEVVVAKRLLAGVSSWTVGVARMGLGSVALLGWLAVRGQLGALVSLTGAEVGWALATGALLAGYVATWFAALARAQAVDVTAVLVLAAPVTALLSAAVNGTTLAPQTPWLAMVVLGGVTMAWLGWRAGPLGGAPVRVETPR